MLQTLSALAVVVALILGLRILLQKTSGGRAFTPETPLVEVVARSAIGFKTSILFLRVNQRIIVASQTPQGLSTLTVLDQPEDVEWVLAQTQPGRPASGVEDARREVSGLLERIRALKSGGKGER